jgi:hypothetical protein
MNWQTLSLHFKQTLEGGFRYLDRCGEFILEAVERLNFVPGETKPSGAKLEIPELGLKATVDTTELNAVQEIPGEETKPFLKACVDLVALAHKHFTPTRVVKNGFAAKYFVGFANAEAALQASLKFGDDYHQELGKVLGMVPAHKHLDYNFASGSLDLHVSLQPVTFEKLASFRRAATFKASRDERAQVERHNLSADRTGRIPGHAVMLELDLIEFDPPKDALEKHFQELLRLRSVLRKQFDVL